MFISFEGGEGAGKTTQIRLLADFLENQGVPLVQVREPGGSAGAEAIRALVLSGAPDRWDGVEELLLFSAARHELVRTTIQPALAEGRWVLCDRYADSSAVYQGRAGGVPEADLRAIETLATGGLQPHITFLLDLPVTTGLARAGHRLAGQRSGLDEARFEGKDLGFHAAVRDAFLDRAKAFEDRFRVLDGTQAVEQLAAQIQRVVGSYLS